MSEAAKQIDLAEELKDLPDARSLRDLPHNAVYVLMLGGAIQYIGQTTYLQNRIGAHRGYKKFDSVKYVPVLKDRLRAVEAAMIRRYRPPLNTIRGSVNFSGLDVEILRSVGITPVGAKGIEMLDPPKPGAA